jgi:hypothetical protein
MFFHFRFLFSPSWTLSTRGSPAMWRPCSPRPVEIPGRLSFTSITLVRLIAKSSDSF